MDKVILTTGGTGGHIFPALAVAEELRRRNPGIELLFIGSDYGPEAKIAKAAGIPFRGLPVRGFLGRGLKAIPAATRLAAAVLDAIGLTRSFKPQIVAGFGGYASFAPAAAACLLRIPLILHEQNAIAGSGNSLLAKFAKRVCSSWPGTLGLPADSIVTGNPVRSEIAAAYNQRQERGFGLTKRLLVLGGSQGAHALNAFMPRILRRMRDAGVEIRHQCGEKDYAELKEDYARNGYSSDSVTPFIDDMAEAYAWADLALCRAGASTLAELCASGLSAVLVPFPAAIHDHQTCNARNLAKAGAAVLEPESGLDEDRVAELLAGLLADGERLENMSRAALGMARINAAGLIVNEMESL